MTRHDLERLALAAHHRGDTWQAYYRTHAGDVAQADQSDRLPLLYGTMPIDTAWERPAEWELDPDLPPPAQMPFPTEPDEVTTAARLSVCRKTRWASSSCGHAQQLRRVAVYCYHLRTLLHEGTNRMNASELEQAALTYHRQGKTWDAFYRTHWKSIAGLDLHDRRPLQTRLCAIVVEGDACGLTVLDSGWERPADWELDG